MYLLLGYGKSNKSIEKYLVKKNIDYCIYDDEQFKCDINLNNISLVIKSNGIRDNHIIIEKAKLNNIKIVSDLQYFYSVTNNKNYCLVTGSNGKTTIVSLLEMTLENSKAIGNNGLAFFDYIDSNKYKILEVSSFMLENIKYIKYKYNIISNVFPTHLEHHNSFINYIKSKLSFLKFITTDCYVIYNKDDVLLNRIIDCYNFKKISISLHDNNATVSVKDNYICYKGIELINIKNIKIPGKHNLYNIMLVIGVLMNHRLRNNDFINKICNYTGLKYRLQTIYNEKFKIINDSKSTNFKALSVALDSLENNIILIVGGKQRNDNYNLLDYHLQKIKHAYCYGENKNEFYNYFVENKIKTNKYNTLEEVIDVLQVDDNYNVLFSPGSASYDQYVNFEERGEHFNKLISNKYYFKK